MAKTGIKINVSNTTFAGVPKVNENSILFFLGVDSTKLRTNVLAEVRSAEEFKTKMLTSQEGLTEDDKSIVKQVEDYFNPTLTISNNGKLLWVYLVSIDDTFPYDDGGNQNTITSSDLAELLAQVVRETVVDGFENRPRQMLISSGLNISNVHVSTLVEGANALNPIEAAQIAITNLYEEGFSMVGVSSKTTGDLSTIEVSGNGFISVLSSGVTAPFVADCMVSDKVGGVAAIAKVGGYLITKSIGASIGDVSSDSFASEMYLLTNDGSGSAAESISVASLPLSVVEKLGEENYLFCRTRAPRNGLWWNDGATCADSATALSTLEAGRTIAAIVDDLREFFTAFINTRVPVADNGDIQSTYKQVVLDSAFAQVIQPYISSGDISNARIELKALNDNMVESRTWEVKVSILPAPTLRWIDGFVFYVKSLE